MTKKNRSRYKTFNSFLVQKYGEKTYKIPINIKVTCPNRDGNVGKGGCIFCGEEAAGYETLSNNIPIKEQYIKNRDYIGNKYNAKYFIVYLQNFTNTYLPDEDFIKLINEFDGLDQNIKAIYISTRPDSINEKKMDFLRSFKENNNIDVVIELGLQTVNYKTLKILNRGHSLSHFIWTVNQIKKRGIDVCAHTIIDLPFDDILDVIETANIINALDVDQVKCHSLYILKGTKLGEMYLKEQIKPIEYDEYLKRMVSFIRYINNEVVIQRLVGRAPEERSLFCNYNKSWWKMKDDIDNILEENDYRQGDLFSGFTVKLY